MLKEYKKKKKKKLMNIETKINFTIKISKTARTARFLPGRRLARI
jgi:hypothetical protein